MFYVGVAKDESMEHLTSMLSFGLVNLGGLCICEPVSNDLDAY